MGAPGGGEAGPRAAPGRRSGQHDQIRARRGAHDSGLADEKLERWTHPLESRPLWNKESSLLRCAVRWRADRRSFACSAYPCHHRARSWQISAHQCGFIGLSTRLLHEREADTRLLDGRSGTSSYPEALENRRGSPGTDCGTRLRCVSDREDGWDQRQVLSCGATS